MSIKDAKTDYIYNIPILNTLVEFLLAIHSKTSLYQRPSTVIYCSYVINDGFLWRFYLHTNTLSYNFRCTNNPLRSQYPRLFSGTL